MNQLEEARAGIDAVDAQLTELFEKRFALVSQIIDYKIVHRLPIKDEGREEQILARNTARIQNQDFEPYFRTWYLSMLELSREYQKDYLAQK